MKLKVPHKLQGFRDFSMTFTKSELFLGLKVLMLPVLLTLFFPAQEDSTGVNSLFPLRKPKG